MLTILMLNLTHAQDKINQYRLSNEQLSFTLTAKDAIIDHEVYLSKSHPTNSDKAFQLKTDGGFNFEVMWTYWQAPGKLHNAENPVNFTQKDFKIEQVDIKEGADGQTMTIKLKPLKGHLDVSLVYQLPKEAFYIRKKLIIQDHKAHKHFLQKISPIDETLEKQQVDKVIKTGGFGQPIGLLSGDKGIFVALEYPAADQYLQENKDNYNLRCSQEIGQKIDSKGIESAWTVTGITPDNRLRWWFYQYMDDIRFTIDKPYTLYNSWYDLRSPAFKKIPPENIMNEKNIMRIIDLIRKNMTDQYGIHLDAFVLDDGWDIYESDWVTRKETFPNGMKPISDKLKQMNTGLGIWFGPTGGYSFRNKRIAWMMKHGYEVVGDTSKRHDAMLCMAGKNYSNLFRKRTVDFVKDEGVSFFKWDGIQFSCSEPDHGHPVGIYSRRAVMESVADKCDAVRQINPDVYLNITSGTWLSPWWLNYANQIWMQGYDYGFANTPSISKRDAAMTYRDYVLWDDFQNHDNWFPIANLMTHGIIKGNLQKLGGEKEPLDKFTNNALLYFARGVSMYELYISPDILNDDEWKAISQSLQWAKNRFDILKNTFYTGGNPAEQEAYAYVHFKDKKGIIAARNPFIEAQKLSIKLDAGFGLDYDAQDLIVEQVYPYHYIYGQTYKTGDELEIQLNGYETAVFEIYPRKEASWPLVAHTKFRYKITGDKTVEYHFYDYDKPVLLNPEIVKKAYDNRKKIKDITQYFTTSQDKPDSQTGKIAYKENQIAFSVEIPSNAENVQIALLYKTGEKTGKLPVIKLENSQGISFDNEYKQKNKWIWKTYKTSADKLSGTFVFDNTEKINPEQAKLYVLYDQKTANPVKFNFKLKKKISGRIMPPEIYKEGYVKRIQMLE